MLNYYRQHKEILGQEPESIDTLFPAKNLEGVNAAEAAAWVGITRVLLNLDEFITRG